MSTIQAINKTYSPSAKPRLLARIIDEATFGAKALQEAAFNIQRIGDPNKLPSSRVSYGNYLRGFRSTCVEFIRGIIRGE